MILTDSYFICTLAYCNDYRLLVYFDLGYIDSLKMNQTLHNIFMKKVSNPSFYRPYSEVNVISIMIHNFGMFGFVTVIIFYKNLSKKYW